MRLTNLDMDALRSFAAGMDAGSFARAADRLGRSTSAVSAQLKKLEAQAGVSIMRRSGRGLALTESGEALLSYARRLLALNDEAIGAVRGVELEGWVRLGLQADFGETILPQVLGRFARAHPKVRIEGRTARNRELADRVAAGQLDLALAWDDGRAEGERIASIPITWLGAAGGETGWTPGADEPLPLVSLEAPCILRSLACDHLDRAGIAWRIAFVSTSLSGLWAATAAGLGVALRTPVGLPATIRMLDSVTENLPAMPSLGLMLYRTGEHNNLLADHLAGILRDALIQALPAEWIAQTGADSRAGKALSPA
ncbi:LysR substrate-binding domain-containing protein [Sphingomonas sp. QA11]|uniref:LysR substrate-binding domain-containing protein n=1 Tax=Sphingomonas sp. QA11 TaxID=2950605 RepID=UPI00234AFCF2|nr:LysR substrate-binding domain-containing protein [Sphingomonas sp. QA11]WCM25972.1 LysR substrate-binding domain-containing protein [Sphingomonas sp. QA11]